MKNTHTHIDNIHEYNICLEKCSILINEKFIVKTPVMNENFLIKCRSVLFKSPEVKEIMFRYVPVSLDRDHYVILVDMEYTTNTEECYKFIYTIVRR